MWRVTFHSCRSRLWWFYFVTCFHRCLIWVSLCLWPLVRRLCPESIIRCVIYQSCLVSAGVLPVNEWLAKREMNHTNRETLPPLLPQCLLPFVNGSVQWPCWVVWINSVLFCFYSPGLFSLCKRQVEWMIDRLRGQGGLKFLRCTCIFFFPQVLVIKDCTCVFVSQCPMLSLQQ